MYESLKEKAKVINSAMHRYKIRAQTSSKWIPVKGQTDTRNPESDGMTICMLLCFKKALLVLSALREVIDHSHVFPLDVHQQVFTLTLAVCNHPNKGSTTGTCPRLTEHKLPQPYCKCIIITLINNDTQQINSSWFVVPHTKWPPSVEPNGSKELKNIREVWYLFNLTKWAGIQ